MGGETFYKWGDLLVLITDSHGHNCMIPDIYMIYRYDIDIEYLYIQHQNYMIYIW